MGKIEEPWEPFNIQLTIEGNTEQLLVVPDQDGLKYEIFDQHTSIGTVWQVKQEQEKIWCGEGLIVRELIVQIGEQMDDYLDNKPL